RAAPRCGARRSVGRGSGVPRLSRRLGGERRLPGGTSLVRRAVAPTADHGGGDGTGASGVQDGRFRARRPDMANSSGGPRVAARDVIHPAAVPETGERGSTCFERDLLRGSGPTRHFVRSFLSRHPPAVARAPAGPG